MAFEHLTAAAICAFAKAVTGVRALWRGSSPTARQRIYFANHTSHGDFVLIWAALPGALRGRTRPVARADYWQRGAWRRFIVERVFRGVLIAPAAGRHHAFNPLEQMNAALAEGDSLIVFPEGTRNPGVGLLPFKSGLYHLARAHPEVEFIPVWIENLGRVMPKGALIPIPLLCTLCFGQALEIRPDESKPDFLERARASMLALAPPGD
ncbi:lysophospholipid acyltransferase family protein [Dechloromonas sp. A34]|uniref:lysophospholipid acyltransferase family protein n=1 Tax=Dechloromonas sp. A34 TaxID=447588 RepID=UPI002249769F|nr:lysophospholipid acyltransferase family protein [Dechloromonas sp. A34]